MSIKELTEDLKYDRANYLRNLEKTEMKNTTKWTWRQL